MTELAHLVSLYPILRQLITPQASPDPNPRAAADTVKTPHLVKCVSNSTSGRGLKKLQAESRSPYLHKPVTAEWQAVKEPASDSGTSTFYSNSRVGQCRFSLQSLVAGMGVQQAPRKVSPQHIYGPGPGPPGAIYDRPHTLRDYGQVSALPFYQQQQSVLASQQFTTLRLLSVGSP